MTDDYSGTWPFLERSRETAALLEGLTVSDSAGVLILGPAGVGKTAIAREVAAALDGTAYVMFIRGSAAMAGTPYGALGVLLLDLDTTAGTGSLLMLQSLKVAMLERAREREVVLVVDNVQHLDEASVMVLSFLAEVGAARLLVACDSPARAPHRFFELWRKGLLDRVDVDALSFTSMTLLLEKLLDGPLSGAAAVELWRASRGNPRYLQAAVRDEVASGRLTRSGAAWIRRRGRDGDAPGQRSDGVLGVLSGLSADARRALDVIVAAGPVPLDVLLPSYDTVILDELEQAGVCVIDGEPPHNIGVMNGAIEDRARWQLITSPRFTLLDDLQRLQNDPLLSTRGRLNLLGWSLDTKAPLSDPYLGAVAREANEADEPELALRAIGRLVEVDDAAALESIRACIDVRRFPEAHAGLEQALLDEPGDPLHRALLLCEQVRLRVRSPQHQEETGPLLGQLERLVGTLPMPDRDRAADAARSVAVEAAASEGRFTQVLELTASTDADQSDTRTTATDQAHVLLARSFTGEGSDAARFMARLPSPRTPVPTILNRRASREKVFLALVHEGHLEYALKLTDARALAAGSWQDASVPDCLRGGALASMGQGRAALAVLLPAIEQLQADNRSGLLPLAEAAAAYAYALVGKTSEAERRAGVISGAERMTWTQQAVMTLFATLTGGLLADSEAAGRRFAIMADEERNAGNHGVELLLRMHAVRLGQEAEVPLLRERAEDISSPFAGACHLLARGVSGSDPHVLLEAAEASFGIGHWDLAGSAALMSMRLHDTEDEPLHFIRAEQIFRRTHVPRRNASARRILTDRERVFARLAARGATNREIASTYHLSVRTVEGHILKAMTKLGISNRKQLATVFT